MEIGECSVADEDSKPVDRPQHLTTQTTGLDGSGDTESGIVSFYTFAHQYWMNTVLLHMTGFCSSMHFTVLSIVLHFYDVSVFEYRSIKYLKPD